ncbi:hypothetical protein K8S17_00050, partial [bacterium]|nr:hypothetical protein [bacterium]
RWYDARREMNRAMRILPRLGSFSTDVFKNREGLDGLRIVRVGGDRAVIVPVAGRETVQYRMEYPRGNGMVPARGVPVSFRGGGDIAWVTPASAETDARGEIEVDIVAGTRIGEEQITIEVDGTVPGGSGLSDAPGKLFKAAGPILMQRVLVTSERGVTVCVELDAADGTDAERVREGLSLSLETLGSSLSPCSPDVDLLVSVSIVAGTEETHGVWLSRVECEVAVFDQRLAEDVGEITLMVKETGERAARDVEVLTLHEAGRLIAVFLEPRLARR